MMAYDPFIEETLMSDHGVLPVDAVDEVLAQSDFVSMHAPARPEVPSPADREAFPPDEEDRASSSTPAAARRSTRKR